MNYNHVMPEDFTPEQKQYISMIKNSIDALYSPEKNFSAIKSIESSFILASAYTAKLVGLSHEEDIVGRFDRDMPCKAAEFAQDFIDEDKELIAHEDTSKKKSMLSIHEYATGLESLVSYKTLIIHQPSQSILGIVAIAHKIDLSDFFNLIPNPISEFGENGNLENVYGALTIGDISLTEYEHEVSYLKIKRNMGYQEIADFMNKYRPTVIPRTADTIYKCRDRICEKLDCDPSHFEESLRGIDIHKKVPSSFLRRLTGNRPLS